MASGVNKVILVGNLGADPDMRYTPSGAGVCELRLATNESWTDKSGQRQERTEWHRIVVWGKLGEVCDKYLSKGRQVYVEGRIQTRSWDDKEGNKRYTTEIIASEVQFLGGRGDGDDGGGRDHERGRRRDEPGRDQGGRPGGYRTGEAKRPAQGDSYDGSSGGYGYPGGDTPKYGGTPLSEYDPDGDIPY